VSPATEICLAPACVKVRPKVVVEVAADEALSLPRPGQPIVN
jgi:hypothetical protein